MKATASQAEFAAVQAPNLNQVKKETGRQIYLDAVASANWHRYNKARKKANAALSDADAGRRCKMVTET